MPLDPIIGFDHIQFNGTTSIFAFLPPLGSMNTLIGYKHIVRDQRPDRKAICSSPITSLRITRTLLAIALATFYIKHGIEL